VCERERERVIYTYIQISILYALLYLPVLLSYERTHKPTSHSKYRRGRKGERKGDREGGKERG